MMLGGGSILRRSWETAVKRWTTGDETPESPTSESTESPQPRRRKSRNNQIRQAKTPTMNAKSEIVKAEELIQIMCNVPLRYSGCSWKRLFSTNIDGVSLGTFYRRMKTINRPIILLIRDDKGDCFGCYGEPWRIEKAYYGNGEAFVFKIRPKQKIWRWMKKNSYFQFGTNHFIAMGGGGNFALYLDSMFEKGSSAECQTFGNECLASSTNFDVVVLEAWALVPTLSMDKSSSSS